MHGDKRRTLPAVGVYHGRAPYLYAVLFIFWPFTRMSPVWMPVDLRPANTSSSVVFPAVNTQQPTEIESKPFGTK